MRGVDVDRAEKIRYIGPHDMQPHRSAPERTEHLENLARFHNIITDARSPKAFLYKVQI